MTLETLQRRSDALRSEIGKTVLGQEEAVDMLLIALFARGHVLLEGPPGTAKPCLPAALQRRWICNSGVFSSPPT